MVDDRSKESEYAVSSYRYLRLSIVILVVTLGVSIAIERARASCWQGSISAYYYTPVHSLFVGALVSIGVTLVAGVVMGFRTSTSPLSIVAALLLVLFFAWCMCWVAIWLGMIAREAGSVQGIGFLALFPLTFGSSMFAAADTMPGWLRSWVDINPVTHLTDAVRGLLTGGPAMQDALISLGTSALILAVFAPLAVRAYRTKA